MNDKLMVNKILIASTNKGKVAEFKKMLEPFDVEILSAAEFDITPPDETGNTFKENSDLKALYYAKQTNLPALADDSGLCIKELDNKPGIYSARWIGESKDYNAGINKIIDLLQKEGLTTSAAHFVCSISLALPNDLIIGASGELHGKVEFPAKGNNGFGYDPIFIPQGYNKTLAELSSEIKNKISHRAIAFDRLVKDLIL